MIRIRGLAILLTLSLLLVPATCADASGPHSIFVDPMANHDHHSGSEAHHQDEHVVMTQEELELHVLLGHISLEQADAIEAGDTENPFSPAPAATQQVEANPCDHGPRLRDLPSSMAMAAAMTPVVLDDLNMIELPCAEAPEATMMLAPAPMAHTPESPPPQV
jgi:hypothetical protein